MSHFARIYGTKNTLHVDYVARTVTLEGRPSALGALSRAVLPFAQARQQLRAGFRKLVRFARSDFHYFAGLRHLIGLFYASIVHDAPPPIPYRDILRISAMTEEIIRQLPLKQLGWRPLVSTDEGMRRTFQYLRSHLVDSELAAAR